MKRLAVLLALLLALPAAARPKLTLFIAVDSMGSDVFLRNRSHYTSGFKRLLDQAAFFPDVQYEQSETVTAAGHAVLSTGAYPWRTGAVANAIYNRQTGKLEPIFADPEHPVLEAPLDDEDVSPVRLMTETLLDRVVLATAGQGRAIAISAKGRAAIALAGHLGQPYWFDSAVGRFVTGTFNAKDPPTWLAKLNQRGLPQAYFDRTWSPLLKSRQYTGDDDRRFEADWHGLGRAFPHRVNGELSKPGRDFYEALDATPFMNDLLVEAAKAAMTAEKLGHHSAPDVLAISFSPVDYVYHLYGPYSWETQDMLARLDRDLGKLIDAAVKAAGGKDNLLVVLSADHGGAAIPEEWSAAGLPAGRVDQRVLARALGDALAVKFGGPVLLGIEEENVYLDDRAIAERKLDAKAIRRFAANWLRQQSSVQLAVSADDLDSLPPLIGLRDAIRRSYFPGRSGDVIFIAKPFHVVTDKPTGTSHAQPYRYDTQVPLFVMGKGIPAGRYAREVHPTDVAPTVATLLEIGIPASAEGQPLWEIMGPTPAKTR